MTGRINKVQNVIPAFKFVFHLYGMALYRNSSFPFQVHVIQHLILKVAVCQGVRQLDQPVSQCTLSVVNMRYDAKIPDVIHEQKLCFTRYKDIYLCLNKNRIPRNPGTSLNH